MQKKQARQKIRFSKKDFSPEGFNWRHYDFALFISKSVYAHNLDDVIKEKEAKNHAAMLGGYLQSLGKINRESFDKWEKKHRLSFLINAYHAYQMQLMLDKDFKNLDEKMMQQAGAVKLFQQEYSLTDFAHNEILVPYGRPEIVFSLHCFSQGCPEYRNKIYNYLNLDKELAVSTRRFFLHPEKTTFSANTNRLLLPSFTKSYKNALPKSPKKWKEFLASYLEKQEDKMKIINAPTFSVQVL